jgi:hypothetical protein
MPPHLMPAAICCSFFAIDFAAPPRRFERPLRMFVFRHAEPLLRHAYACSRFATPPVFAIAAAIAFTLIAFRRRLRRFHASFQLYFVTLLMPLPPRFFFFISPLSCFACPTRRHLAIFRCACHIFRAAIFRRFRPGCLLHSLFCFTPRLAMLSVIVFAMPLLLAPMPYYILFLFARRPPILCRWRHYCCHAIDAAAEPDAPLFDMLAAILTLRAQLRFDTLLRDILLAAALICLYAPCQRCQLLIVAFVTPSLDTDLAPFSAAGCYCFSAAPLCYAALRLAMPSPFSPPDATALPAIFTAIFFAFSYAA